MWKHLNQCEHVCFLCVQLCMSRYIQCGVFVLYVFILMDPPLQNFMNILIKNHLWSLWRFSMETLYVCCQIESNRLLSDKYCTSMYYSDPHLVRYSQKSAMCFKAQTLYSAKIMCQLSLWWETTHNFFSMSFERSYSL